jgi:hypothetical protein
MGLVEVLVEAASSDGGHIMLELARDMRQNRTGRRRVSATCGHAIGGMTGRGVPPVTAATS